MEDQPEVAIDFWPTFANGFPHQQGSRGVDTHMGAALPGSQWWPDDHTG